MPITLKAVRILITIQVAFGLVGAGLFLALFFSSFAWQYLLVLAFVAGSTALLGWLLSQWNSRRIYLRWSLVAMQVVPAGVEVVDMVLYSTVDWRSVAVGNSLGWVVVVLLLLPSAGRWFDKPRELR
ncbi:hypothetical protein [Nonomuraea bangladeshensis]|uniref:hypothetical protein n=1 Tax=Nonomuraea bangladeshensis TaxID=404385 RepID=UPI0031E336B2